MYTVCILLFQSTHPLRDATRGTEVYTGLMINFNPRTPYGMRPRCLFTPKFHSIDFNPRTPYGMRLGKSKKLENILWIFQSTHPLRDATYGIILNDDLQKNFNPRTPYGMRRSKIEHNITKYKFQSTHPLRDATLARSIVCSLSIFQSTHPLRDATNE